VTLREGMSPEKLAAFRILDKVRAGLPVPLEQVNLALHILGDLTGE
jgi:hypothetical protein